MTGHTLSIGYRRTGDPFRHSLLLDVTTGRQKSELVHKNKWVYFYLIDFKLLLTM
jgi:hypothetical protein